MSMEEDHNDALQSLQKQLETEKKERNKFEKVGRERVLALEGRLEGVLSDLKTTRRRAEELEASLALAQRYDEPSPKRTIFIIFTYLPHTRTENRLYPPCNTLPYTLFIPLTPANSSSNTPITPSHLFSQGRNCQRKPHRELPPGKPHLEHTHSNTPLIILTIPLSHIL